MEISGSESDVFSVRIVSIDYYMAPPIPELDISYSSFQGGKVNEVPIIRVYGPTPGGQKTCLHIHRVLPYLYVPCEKILLQPQQEGVAFANDLSSALEKALKLKGNANSKQRQHVHSVNLVRARKFYGYHSSEELFVKICLYYPNDVSRAATLLLNGAVLDKSLQPHESHIPFLLQFLVDYSLYGMSHLHLSKMKFRHPVPDVCSQKRSKHFYMQEKEMDKLTCMTSDYKADPSYDPNHLPIWISSTIPVDWMVKSPSSIDASADQRFSFCKRQSVCELEGDAAADDILNQQFKMYTTLSQTGSDVKMVQSLVSIWEEEYRRIGAQEVPISLDPGKPLPEEVLKTFSFGLDYQEKMNELFGKADDLSFLASSIEDEKAVVLSKTHSFDEKKSIGLGHFYLDNVGVEALNPDEEINTKGSQLYGSLSDEFGKSSAIGCEISQNVISTNEVRASPKVADEDAHNLLRWLASSQAAHDINSDDELICETILSPLLPAATIEKVVEKANMDYECESQKECQDILDSIDDFIEFKGSTERSSKILLEKLIPQVDGSSDNLLSFPCNDSAENPVVDGSGDDFSSPPCDDSAGKSQLSEVDKSKYERCSGFNLLQGIEERLSSYKRDVSVWGSIPLLSREEAQKDVYIPLDSTNALVQGNVYSRGEIIGSEKEENHEDSLIKKAEVDVYDSADTSVLAKCSLRDMMRRKRLYRTESREVGSHKVKRALWDEKAKVPEDKLGMTHDNCFHITKTFIDQQVLNQNVDSKPPILFDSVGSLQVGSINDSNMYGYEKFDDKVGEGAGSKPGNSSITAPQLFTGPVSSKPEILESSVTETHFAAFDRGQSCTSYVNTRDSKGMSPENMGDMICLNFGIKNTHPNDNLEIDNSGNKQAKKSLVLSGVGSSVNMEIKGKDLLGLTFCRKPPSADMVNEYLHKISKTPSFPDNKLVDGASGRAIDDLLPFFLGEERDVFDRACDSSSHQEAAMGVPTHYQNDGSLLYLLTPVQTPPSANDVRGWLSCNHRDIHSTKSVLKFESLPPNVSSGECASESSLANDCDKSPHQSCSLSQTRSIENLASQENPGKPQVDKKVSADNAAMIMEGDGDSLQLSANSDSSHDISQISVPFGKAKSTPLSQTGFRDPASVGGGQQLTLLSIEVLAESRGDLNPDPQYDAVNVVALVFQNDCDSAVDILMLLCSKKVSQKRSPDGISNCNMLVFSDERDLFINFINIICSVDPDIIMGWDVQGCSLGFLAERASLFGIALLKKISRTPLEFKVSDGNLDSPCEEISGNLISESLAGDTGLHKNLVIGDEWGRTHASGVHVGGRIVLNVWRLMRSEVKLHMYTLEAIAEAVLKQKIPLINHKVLTKWFASGPGRARYKCLEYLMRKAKLNLEIINQLDMINRTSELARVFGIDFFSVLSRGSQYRVESMLLRLAHTQNYIAVSPGNQQVASQPAMECLPLVMEPESAFYADPVVVLDFQSLYPSMIIAYNLCFCTCLGKVAPSKEDTLGVISYSPHPKILQSLIDQILLTPNGVMYVAPKVCKGILPRLLEEILSTRIMVKQSMKKLSPSEKVLYRIFDSRQLALKLIANVTYGYTAAGFSGRMPCAELADSIVQCGRATLEKAISFVNSHDKWKGKVIYGDTDSMFVLLKGRTVKEAFCIGQEIVEAITAMNPKPVTLKLEKVYHPCFLLTKKRYVGFSYESPDQVEPIFDAKGIETVRRDTCGAVAKTMEQSLRLFFEHQSVFEVKAYLQRQWKRILSGKVSLQDFVFAKEVRLGTYSTRSSSSLPPAAIVAAKAMRADPRAEPRYAERIPYVVVHGELGARLVDMVVNPSELLAVNSRYRLNDLYYINKQIIPALQRVFGLVGANLNQWFLEVPRPVREGYGKQPSLTKDPKRTRIDFYYLSKHCIVCGELVHASSRICNQCSGKGSAATVVLTRRASIAESEMQHLTAICQHCGGGDPLMENGVKCVSLACSVFYERRKVQKQLGGLVGSAAEKGFYPNCKIEWF